MSIQKPGPTASSSGTSNSTTNTTANATQNASTSPPQWFLDQWKAILGGGNDLYSNFAYPTMGLTPDQQNSSYLTNLALQNFMTKPQVSAYDSFGMGTGWDKGAPPQAAQVGGFNMGSASQAGAAAQAQADKAKFVSSTAAQLNPNDIAQFMNPYIETALNPVLNRLRQQQAETQAGIGGDAAAAHMYGGSREAVQRMLADRNYKDTLANTAGNMLNAGWNTAAGLESQNVDRSQQTNLANAQNENAINSLNAQLGTNVNLQNAQQQNAVSALNAQLGNAYGIAGMQTGAQTGIANAQMQNALSSQYYGNQFQGAQNDVSNFLNAINLQSNNDYKDLTGSLAGASQLNMLGTQQQQTGQAALDQYWQQIGNLSKLLQIGNPGSNSTSNSTTNSTSNQTGTTQNNTSSTKPLDFSSILLGLGGLLK